MSFNPEIHNRQSIRLKGYDYSQPGLYYVTLCCSQRESLFGHIENGIAILNDAGIVAQECWQNIPEHFPNVKLHAYIIMPNHIHGIIEIVYQTKSSPLPVGANDYSPLQVTFKSPSKTIGSIIRGFKIGVTKWMRQNTNIHDVWQRNYYEIIIRDDESYQRITNYIFNNPANWKEDNLFK